MPSLSSAGLDTIYRMRRPSKQWAAISLALAAAVAGAQTAEEYAVAAEANSVSVTSARAAVTSASARLAALEHPSTALLSLGSGETRFSFPAGGTVIETAPEATVDLARPFGTKITASVGIDAMPGSAPDTTPGVSVTQPLDDVLGLAAERTDILSARAELLRAGTTLRSAQAGVRTETFSALKAWADAVLAVDDAEFKLGEARTDLEEASKLGSYKPGSTTLATLETAVASAGARLANAKRVAQLRAAAVERRTGLSASKPPPPPESQAFPDLAKVAPESFAEIAASKSELYAAERIASEALGGDRLSLSAVGSYKTVQEQITSSLATWGDIYAGVEGGYGDFSASLGGGWSRHAGGYPYTSFSFAWKPSRVSDEKADGIVAAAQLEKSQATHEKALDDAVSTLAAWIESAAAQELDGAIVQANRASAEASLAEIAAREAAGYGSARETRKARRAILDLDREAAALAWSRAVLIETMKASMDTNGGSR